MIALRRHLLPALVLAGAVASTDTMAVRLATDGLGQALIYPYYTARTRASGNAYVTALSMINATSRPKALKMRFLESKVGAEVLSVNLYLGPYDAWTAGIVGAGTGAGLFTADHSCTSPTVSIDPSVPTKFRNGAYVGDLLGDSLDRTFDGYVEVLEMGTIDPASVLGTNAIAASDFRAPNASRSPCAQLPVGTDVPDLLRPAGGLYGGMSLINVSDGTDISVDAIALSQWSDKPQWSAPGGAVPTLADTSPFTSVVAGLADQLYITRWNRGQDAVSALFMAERLRNDYTAEYGIKATTDWVMTSPTKRFYTSPTQSAAPFVGGPSAGTGNRSYCEWRYVFGEEYSYYDREGQILIDYSCNFICFPSYRKIACGAAGVMTFTADYGDAPVSNLFESRTVLNNAMKPYWINGFADYDMTPTNGPGLAAPSGSTTIIDLVDGSVHEGASVTYAGLPVVGFAAQSYSTTGLPGVNPNVVSSYGGSFVHKAVRKVIVAP